MKPTPRLDVLVLATHPDDAESTCGGTIAKLVSRGAKVGVLDASRGEMGTRGTVADRDRECRAASRVLRLAWRANLGLPDGRVRPTPEARERIASWIRRTKPTLFIAPWHRDLHPDHAAVGVMARQAYFLSGLRRLDPRTEPHRPDRVLYYPSLDLFRPQLVVALSDRFFEWKLRALRCYASQLKPAGKSDRGRHFIHGQDLEERISLRARFFGASVRVRYGEPFRVEGMLSDADPLSIPGRRSAASPRAASLTT